MPYINIRLSNHPEEVQRAQLYEHTTTLMNKLMGKKREVTVVHIQSSEAGQWSVDAEQLTESSPIAAYVDIKITKGTNTETEISEMIRQTMTMLKNTLGVMQEACYVVIDEVPAYAWGYNGLTQAERAATKR